MNKISLVFFFGPFLFEIKTQTARQFPGRIRVGESDAILHQNNAKPEGCWDYQLRNCAAHGRVGRFGQSIALIRELESDLEFAQDYLGYDDGGARTIEELRQYVIRQKQKTRALEVKQELTHQRRSEFGSRRAQLLLLLIERDGYICKYPGCGVQEDLTIDHIIPISKGGSDNPENLQLMCRSHHSSKGDS